MSIYKKGLAATTLILAFLILTTVFNPHSAYATDSNTNSAQSNLSSSQQEDSLRSATLVYDSDILVPDTGRNTIVIATASGCTMCITFIVATSAIHFLRRRKD